MKPAVTAVIPTHNRAGLLGQAIQSVLGQTFEDLELIVVDDGSTDNTPEVVRSIRDPRVRYIRNEPNRGLAGARNVGIHHARAAWIACLDDDDRWLPDKLEQQIHVVRRSSDPKLTAVYGGVYYDYPDGSTVYYRPRYRGDITGPLLQRPYVVTGGFSCLLFSREAAQDVGGFDERLKMREDFELQLRLSLAGYRFDFVDAPVLRYRADAGDSLSRKARRRVIGILQVYRKHRQHFRSVGSGRHFIDLMHACRFLIETRHPGLARIVYQHAVLRTRPPARSWRYHREYLAIPVKIGVLHLARRVEKGPERHG